MKLTIQTEPKKFFRQFLDLISSFPPVRGTRNKELDVLAILMEQNYKFKDIPDKVRNTVIFSKENKKEICTELNISLDSLYNDLSILRKRKLLLKNNELPKFLNIIPENKYEFSITFIINNNE